MKGRSQALLANFILFPLSMGKNASNREVMSRDDEPL